MEAEATEPLEAVEPTRSRVRPKRSPRQITVTAVEREAYALRRSKDPPMTWGEMSRRMKKDRRTIQRAYERAEQKIPLEGQIQSPPGSLEEEDPEKYAEFVTEIVSAESPIAKVSAVAERLGIPPPVAVAIAKRLRETYPLLKEEIHVVKRDYLKRRWGFLAKDALDAITEEKLLKASAKDLGILAAISTDKLLLLQGLPTQIVRTERDRAKLGDLAEALMIEMSRRGVKLDGVPTPAVLDVECSRIPSEGG